MRLLTANCSLLITLGVAALAHAQVPVRDTSAAPTSAGTGVIQGRVTEAGSTRPLPNAVVHAVSTTAPRIDKSGFTDASGRYQIPDVPVGTYTVSSTKTNYVPAFFGIQRAVGPGKPIVVAAGQTIDRIDLALTRDGVITGRITDEFGDPAIEVQVAPMRSAFVNGERRLQPGGPSVTTNDLGEYRLYGLRPGQYAISATLRNFSGGDGGIVQTAYAPTFFPGTASPSAAQRFTIAPGQTVTDINMTLVRATAVSVSGVASDAQGHPVPNGSSVMLVPHGGIGGPIAGAPIRDGVFKLNGVVPGDYTLRVNSQVLQQKEYAQMDISVGSTEISGVQVVAARLSTVRGRLTIDDSAAKAPSPTALRLNILHPDTTMNVGVAGNAKEDATFEITTGAGRGFLQVSGGGDWRAKRILVGGVDVHDTGFDIPLNGAVTDVVVELTTHHTDVSASVVDETGTPVSAATIVVFAQDPQRWPTPTRYFWTGRIGTDAMAHIRSLPAGAYMAAAFDTDETNLGLFQDPELLTQLREHATAFTLADDEIKSVAIKIGAPPVF